MYNRRNEILGIIILPKKYPIITEETNLIQLYIYLFRNLSDICNNVTEKNCKLNLIPNEIKFYLKSTSFTDILKICKSKRKRKKLINIGKKLAKFKRSRKPLKGRKNKRRYKIDSDWQDYYGSSDELTIDIKKLGKEYFKREILFYCNSKAEMSYVEAREQFARKVLESNDYYNGHIRVRVHGKGILKEKAST